MLGIVLVEAVRVPNQGLSAGISRITTCVIPEMNSDHCESGLKERSIDLHQVDREKNGARRAPVLGSLG